MGNFGRDDNRGGGFRGGYNRGGGRGGFGGRGGSKIIDKTAVDIKPTIERVMMARVM